MKIIFNIFLFCLLSSFVGYSDASCKNINEKLEMAKLTFEAGYYWRDYYGDIPDDAFQGGTDVNGDPIYSGQSLGTFLVPGKIYGSNKNSSYELHGEEHNSTHQVKILCTRNPEQLKWIQTDHIRIRSLTYENLIIGGYEHEQNSYIGRALYNNELSVGKVRNSHFYTTANGKRVELLTFEVLSLDKNAPMVQCIY